MIMSELHLSEQEIIRRNKMNDLKEKGIDPFGQKFVRTANSASIKAAYAEKTKEELEAKLNMCIPKTRRLSHTTKQNIHCMQTVML